MDQQPPQPVGHHRHGEDDEEYLYSQSHSHIMLGRGLRGKPHTGAKASGKGVVSVQVCKKPRPLTMTATVWFLLEVD